MLFRSKWEWADGCPRMSAKRTHIVIPGELVTQIDTLVGKRGRSAFLVSVAEKELIRLRQIRALEAASGSWKDKDHPELKQGTAVWVSKVRREYEHRFEKAIAR